MKAKKEGTKTAHVSPTECVTSDGDFRRVLCRMAACASYLLFVSPVNALPMLGALLQLMTHRGQEWQGDLVLEEILHVFGEVMNIPHHSLVTVSITVGASQIGICGCELVQLFPLLDQLLDVLVDLAIVVGLMVEIIQLGIPEHEQRNLKLLQLLHCPEVTILALRRVLLQILVERLRHGLEIITLEIITRDLGPCSAQVIGMGPVCASWLCHVVQHGWSGGVLASGEAIVTALNPECVDRSTLGTPVWSFTSVCCQLIEKMLSSEQMLIHGILIRRSCLPIAWLEDLQSVEGLPHSHNQTV